MTRVGPDYQDIRDRLQRSSATLQDARAIIDMLLAECARRDHDLRALHEQFKIDIEKLRLEFTQELQVLSVELNKLRTRETFNAGPTPLDSLQ